MKLGEVCEDMKCPCCGKAMTSGVVQSARKIIYTTEPKDVFLLATGEDVVLSSHNFTGPTCLAFICKECRKVMIDYSVDVEFNIK